MRAHFRRVDSRQDKLPIREYRKFVHQGGGGGFEPANLCGLHAFQACALSQTTRPLRFLDGQIIPQGILLITQKMGTDFPSLTEFNP